MSTTIDSKIVEMKFDNREFEANVKTSMSTLDKLKEKLHFKNASEGLEELSKASEKLDMRNTVSGIEKVNVQFSAMYTMATRIFERLTDQAINMVKAMSIDQVTAGFSKYEQKTTSIQTIMSATGESIDYVNEVLEKLNWFTDETSYNFTDMVDNIGKFTSAGIDLETATTAMQGIANWAAISGQNAASASRAMYNLAQAMGKGYVQLIDWKSIENANMATKQFKEQVLESAAALGVLKKAGEDANGVMQYTMANGDQVSFQNFSESLSQKWLSKEVLMRVLNEYGAYANAVNSVQEALIEMTGAEVTASQAMQQIDATFTRGKFTGTAEDFKAIGDELGITAEEAAALYEVYNSVGRKAFRAAQEAKTWSDVVSATTDAVSSQWLTTFELIFGDYNEAKRLFTDMANELWDVFAGPISGINDILAGSLYHKETWKDFVDTLNDAGVSSDDLTKKLSEVYASMNADKEDYKSLEELIEYYGSLEAVTERGIITTDMFDKTLQDLKVDSRDLFGTIRELSQMGGRIKMIDALANIYNQIKSLMKAIGDAWSSVFTPLNSDRLSGFIDKFYDFAMNINLTKGNLNSIRETFFGFFSVLRLVSDAFQKTFSSIYSLVKKVLPSIIEFIVTGIHDIGVFLGNSVDDIRNSLSEAYDYLVEWFNEFKESDTFKNLEGYISQVKDYFLGLYSTIKDTVKQLNIDSILDVLMGLGGGILYLGDALIQSKPVQWIFTIISNGITSIANAVKNFRLPTWDEIMDSFKTFSSSIGSNSNFLGYLANGLTNFTKFFSKDIAYKLQSFGKSIANSYIDENGTINKFLKWAREVAVLIKDFLFEAAKISFKTITDVTRKILELANLFAAFKTLMSLSKLFDAVATKISGGPKIVSVFESITDMLKAVAIIIAELGVLTLVFSKMDASQLDRGFNGLKLVLLGLGAVLVAAIVAANVTSESKFTAITAMILSFAIAMSAIANALMKLQNFKWNTAGFIALIGAMAALVTAMHFMKDISGVASAWAMAGFIAALNSLLDVIIRYNDFDWSSNIKGIIGAVGGIMALIVALKALAKTSGTGISDKLSIVGLVISMKILVGVIRDLGEMDAGVLAKGALVLSALTLIIGGMSAAIGALNKKGFGAQGIANLGSFLGVASMLVACAIAITILGKLPREQLLQGGAAVSMLLILISGMSIALGRSARVKMGSIIVMLAGMTTMLVAVGWILSWLLEHDVNSVIGSAASLSAVMLSMAAVVGIVGKFSKDPKSVAIGVATLLALSGILEIVALIFVQIKDIDGVKMLEQVAALDAAIGGLVALAFSASALGKVDPAIVLKGEGVIIAVGALFTAVMSLAGLLESKIGFMSYATDMAQKFGNFIGVLLGSIVGGLVSGFNVSVTNTLPKVGTNLSEFSTNITPFMDTIQKWRQDDFSRIYHFMDSFDEMMQGMHDLITDSDALNGLPGLATKLSSFMHSLSADQGFFASLRGVSEDQLKAAEIVAKIITALSAVGKSHGIKQLWEGKTDYQAVAIGIGKYANAIASIHTTLSAAGFNDDSLKEIDLFAQASEKVNGAFKTMPKSGGLEEFFTGKQKWSNVNTGLGDYITTLTDLKDELVNFDWDEKTSTRFDQFTTATGKLIELQNSIEAKGGIKQDIFGDSSWSNLTDGLFNFVTDFVTFCYQLNTNIDDSEIESAKAKLLKILDMYDSIANADYAGVVNGKITNVINSYVDTVSTAVTSNKERLNWIGSRFGSYIVNGMKDITKDIQDFVSSVIRTLSYELVVRGGEITNLGKGIGYSLTSGFKESTDILKNTATTIVSAVESLLLNGDEKNKSFYSMMYGVGEYAAKGMADGMISTTSMYRIRVAATSVANTAKFTTARVLDENSPSKVFYEMGDFATQGFAEGLLGSISQVSVASTDVGRNAIRSMNNTVKSISEAITMNPDAHPVITPVLDLSNVESGASRMGNMLSGTYKGSLAGLGVSGKLSSSINIQNGNGGMAEVVSSLKNDVSGLKDAILGMNIVMDSGAVVGSISNKMDQSLGKISTYRGRGNR